MFLKFLIFISLCRAYLVLRAGPGPILPVRGPLKAWPSRIHGQLLPVLCTQQPRVVPLISSRWFSTAPKLNFISLSQASIKCPPMLQPLQGTVFICALVQLPLVFASPIPFVTALTEPPPLSCLLLWQQNISTWCQSFPSYCNLKPHFFLLNK